MFSIRHEMAETIEDLLARRTGTQLQGWRQALEAAPVAAALLAKEKNWNSAKTEAAVSEYSGKIRGFLKELALERGLNT